MSKRIALLAAAVITAFAVSACYNDSAIKTDIADLQSRVKTLEDHMLTANNNISAVQDLVKALNGKVLVESVEETEDGWIIKFSNGKTVTVSKGSGPKISAKKDADGIYYWTLDGDWLLGEGGEKLAVTGAAPQLIIEGDYWYISTDGGATWTQLGKAKGDQGGPGDSIFQWVNQDESYWFFALNNGDIIQIGKGIHGAKAVNVIPSFSDGSVKALKGKFTMSFDVLPAESAEGLAGESNNIFNVKVVYTTPATKASNSISLPILSKEGKEGVLLLTVDGAKLDDSFVKGTSGASACLQIVWNDNVLSSGYFPLHPYDPYNGHEYVDLGLPSGLKWATCNVGATKPEDAGNYYAWGETEPKTNYYWDTYKWCNGDGNKLTKYCTNSSYWNSSEPMDNKTALDLEDDAARANWGGSWRMPTNAEWQELKDNCTGTYTILNGANGRLVTGSNGNSIFLPTAGCMKKILLFWGVGGYYWSTSLYTNIPSDTMYCFLGFESDIVGFYPAERFWGYSVRPVCE